jgi:ribosome production factor 1
MSNPKRKKVDVERGETEALNASRVADVTKAVNDSDEVALPKSLSHIKNKDRRRENLLRLKAAERKMKIEAKKKKKALEKALGDKAPPKQIPKTIENQREKDETMITAADEEVEAMEALDEMSGFFNRETPPKILITTADHGSHRTIKFGRDLADVIPNAKYYYRKGLPLKKIIKQCEANGYTELAVINEDRRVPNGLVLCHLPDGPTAHFKLTSSKLSKEMKKKCKKFDKDVKPEVILNNFNTMLGHRVGRMLASLFHYDPNFEGRRVVTFHNQRDYIFFRHHLYGFSEDGKKVGLREIGPRFTLKLRTLQKGTFDTKYGEFEWVHKRHEMETSRRKFFL